ncbi:MAG: hypothetical protein L0099_02340 [Acidobacteria bacterium]|nr:hypothetical protein [Acidobacteriota bacterium]
MITRALLCVAAVFGAAASLMEAQAPFQNCVWPAPQPRCSAWFATEAGLYVRFTDRQAGDETLLLAYSLGWMRNANTRSAWGAEVFGGLEGEVRGGLALRVRRWVPPLAAVDVAAGVHLFGDASSQDVTSGSPMLTVRITYADKVAAAARVDVLKLHCGRDCSPAFVLNPNGTSTRLYIGAELGSQLGVIAAALAAVAVGVSAASCCN